MRDVREDVRRRRVEGGIWGALVDGRGRGMGEGDGGWGGGMGMERRGEGMGWEVGDWGTGEGGIRRRGRERQDGETYHVLKGD